MNIFNRLPYDKDVLMVCTLLALVMGLLVACDDHTDFYDSSLRPGNIYLTDDRVVSPEAFDKDRDDAAGVIFYVHGDTALVVGTRDMGECIYSDTLGTIEGVVNDATSLCGLENTAAIRASVFASRFPALQALGTKPSEVTGWSLPSAGDLRALSSHLPVVERSMLAIGGDPFTSGQYFSTSQDGSSSATEQENYYTVSLRSGRVTSSHKWEKSRVRIILTIK